MAPLIATIDSGPSDSELCCMAAHGSAERAFKLIYTRYRDRIFRLASTYTADSDDASDITQQVFIRAHRSIGQFRGHSQLYTWLYRIAINCCKDWVKQAHYVRNDRRDEAWWSERATGECLFTRPVRTESAVESRETRDILRVALEKLKPEFREALVLREVQGLSYREVGVALSCTEGTVKSRISRARHQLRNELSRLGCDV